MRLRNFTALFILLPLCACGAVPDREAFAPAPPAKQAGPCKQFDGQYHCLDKQEQPAAQPAQTLVRRMPAEPYCGPFAMAVPFGGRYMCQPIYGYGYPYGYGGLGFTIRIGGNRHRR
jgi:hypothetical protein